MNRTSFACRCSLAATALIAVCAPAAAQISLQTAVDLALKNSPRIRAAQADVDRAKAAWQEVHDAYIPVVSTTAGYGQSTGAPLNVPVIFSISAQSLVFSFQQRDTIRAMEQTRISAEHALRREQIQVVQDTTNTYIALESAQTRKAVVRRETELAERLVSVTSDRIAAGVDAKVEFPKAERTSTQIQLVALQLDDDIAYQSRHLATLTGLPTSGMHTDSHSIPQIAEVRKAAVSSAEESDDEGVESLKANALSKQYLAFGDRRYLLRPQITLGANYSRVDAGLSSYAAYYPRFQGTADHPNSQNSLSFGLNFTIPLLDMAHRAKARESEADARHALADVELQRGVFREGRARLQNSVLELQLRSDLAREEQEIAEDQFEALQVQLQADAANLTGPQVTPKDALTAELQERQKYYDLLLARLLLQQTQVNLLQQNGGLSTWVSGTGQATGTVNAPAMPGSMPPGATPTSPGAAPTSRGATPGAPTATPEPLPVPTPQTPR